MTRPLDPPARDDVCIATPLLYSTHIAAKKGDSTYNGHPRERMHSARVTRGSRLEMGVLDGQDQCLSGVYV